MRIVVAALVLLTALTLLNLLLTFGVIRRLRQSPMAAGGPPHTLAVGAPVPEFTAPDAEGGTVTAAALRDGGGLVMFLAPDCSGCQEQLPAVREKLAEAADGALRIVVVLTRLRPSAEPDATAVAALEAALGIAPEQVILVREELDGPVQSAFRVAAFPAFYLFDDTGRVVHAGNGAADLPRLSPVAQVVTAGR
ncbi:TlpA family protein disulfide reductase [Plantactinospora soyae]|uniref:Peroxiredoxin n=1 Tax=Plantactinospora soyae TaxID=1544732 RepID=A0A927R346_9ACTN|nr:redoxin domain-containing protein [Plantactinospora soyae]MBE1491458.1 peroxiredoxin [Plantactinospora soyae]